MSSSLNNEPGLPANNLDDTSSRVPLKALIFDLGDVLFTWSAATTTSIPAKTLRSILNTEAWVEFDCGRITQEQCYNQAAQHVPFSADEIREAFRQARDSLRPNLEVIDAIRALKKSSQGQLQIFAMSNISKEDYAYVATAVDDWQIFDRVFASGLAGMRKPEAAFYRHVLNAVDLSPRDIMFIDDKVENVLAAQNLGMRAVVFSESKVVVDILARIESDPCERGFRCLLSHREDCRTFTETGVTIEDNFAKLLIQEALPFL
jgi:FMN phosphatase YigB (HAD superfamily)